MTQQEVRTLFNEHLNNCGVSQKFIAKSIEKKYGEAIPLDILSRFRTGKRDIWESHLELLEKYLTEQ